MMDREAGLGGQSEEEFHLPGRPGLPCELPGAAAHRAMEGRLVA